MDPENAISLIKAIIRGQQNIIGLLAIEQANKVPGLEVTTSLDVVKMDQTPSKVLTNLVLQYQKLFGRASLDACKESVKEYLPNMSSQDLPDLLR